MPSLFFLEKSRYKITLFQGDFMEKIIEGYEDYCVTDDGKIISYKYKNPKEMKTWTHEKTGYVYANLSKNGKMKHFPVHKLVAKAFIDNPNKYLEVDHINGIRSDNRVNNLEWVTHRENLLRSFKKNSQIRNHHNCKLIQLSTNSEIGSFESIQSAAEYASKHFGCSKSSLIKYKKNQNYKIERCND